MRETAVRKTEPTDCWYCLYPIMIEGDRIQPTVFNEIVSKYQIEYFGR